MISIIVCSRETTLPELLIENINLTIGVSYELIVIDNSDNKYTIFQAYNEGVRRAKYSYLCFTHDDILYHTLNWGKVAIEHLQDELVGLIGIMGTHYLPCKPAYWFDSIKSESLISTVSSRSKKIIRNHFFSDKNFVEAVAVDGIWFCMPKKLFNYVKFDESTFNGFHYYDMDISMQVIKKGYSVRVINNILIEHLKESNLNQNFFDNQLLFFNKWKLEFPISRGVNVDESCISLIDDYCDLKLNFQSLWNERNRILNSKAYRFGKMALKPYAFFKKVRKLFFHK